MIVDITDPVAANLLALVARRNGLSPRAVLTRLILAMAAERPASDVLPYTPLSSAAILTCADWRTSCKNAVAASAAR